MTPRSWTRNARNDEAPPGTRQTSLKRRRPRPPPLPNAVLPGAVERPAQTTCDSPSRSSSASATSTSTSRSAPARNFENFRKRSARESTDAERRGRAHVARGLVPAVDNLERALQAAGVDLIRRRHRITRPCEPRGLGARGARRRRGARLRRDRRRASLRPASSRSTPPVRSSTPTGTRRSRPGRPRTARRPAIVAETIQRGYELGDVLIRPARVVVTS